MSIIKITKRDNPFVQIDKNCLEDASLSFKAKGILAYLLSKPDDWRVMLEDLAKHTNEGLDSIRSGLKELVEAGYAVLKTERNAKGILLGKYYDISEVPNRDRHREKTVDGETPTTVKTRQREKSDDGKKPLTGKSDPTNKEVISNNKKRNNTPVKKLTGGEKDFGYKKIVQMYFDFHVSQTGMEPPFTGADGKAIKKLLEYLAKVSKTKDDVGAVSGFQYIIDNWHKNDDFVYEQLKPAQILHNISRIFIACKKQVA